MPREKSFSVPTPQSLAAAALRYLGRYAASETTLRAMLENRLRGAAMRLPAFAADRARQQALRSVIETIIEGHKRTGAVNDAAFAETKVNSLRRQGGSRRAIEQKLAAKGIRGEALAAAFLRDDEDAGAEAAELKAARALARKRGFGPFRKKPVSAGEKESRHRKDIAALARAGFSFAVIKIVLDGGEDDDFPLDID